MPEVMIVGIASDTDALCLPDARALLGPQKTREAMAEYAAVWDMEGCQYHPVWYRTKEARQCVCQICGIQLSRARGE